MSHSSRQRPRCPKFKIAIEKVFNGWSALKIAIDNGQGGRQGKEIVVWMMGAVEDYFYQNDDLMDYEISEFVGTLMNQELDTIVDDNSLEDIGQQLSTSFNLCKNNKDEELNLLFQKLDAATNYKPTAQAAVNPDQDQESSESEGEEMQS